MNSDVKEKKWFLVKLEGMAPIIAEFRVFAEDEDQAYALVERRPAPNVYVANKPEIDMKRFKIKRASIKNLLTGWMNWVRNF